MSLAGVLDHHQTVSICDLLNRVHISGLAIEMDGEHG